MELLKKFDKIVSLKNSSNAYNPDILPVPVARRRWGYTGYLSYWALCSLCITTWSSGSSLISVGLNGNQAIAVIVIAHLFIGAASVLNGAYGAKYHIGYSVYQRLIFGMRGSVFGVLLRSMLSVVWFSSQAWLGGLCVNLILCSWSKPYLNWKNTLPESVKMSSQELCGFVVYLAISLPVLMIRPEKMDRLLVVASIAVFFVGLGITIWSVKVNGNNYGTLLSAPITLSSSQLGWAWIYGLNSWYSTLVAGISNQSDYTRFTKSDNAAYYGTFIGTNLFGFIVPLFGVISASALYEKYDTYFWMPTDICKHWLETDYSAKSRAAAFFCGLSLVVSQLGINCVGNGLSGGMDLASIFPRYINIRRGSLIVFLLCWPTQPWLFYNSSSVFLTVMSSFSVFVTPLVALFITDFFLVRKGVIKMSDCYKLDSSSLYWYWHGFNFRGFVAFCVGFAPALPGLINATTPDIKINEGAVHFYWGSFIFQFAVTSACYYLLCFFFKIEVGEMDSQDLYGTYKPNECEKYGILPFEEQNVRASSEVELVDVEVKTKEASGDELPHQSSTISI